MTSLYTSSSYSRRPALEFKYSFLESESDNKSQRHYPYVPLDSPVHGNIGDDQWRSEIENLVAESSPGVEDGIMECASERTLSIGAEAI